MKRAITQTPGSGSRRTPLWMIGLMSAATVLGVGRRRREAGSPREDEAERRGTDGRGTDGRGRDAATPSEIPAAGWLDILKRTVSEFSKDRLMLVAAGVTFYVLLAIFPAITALISIYGLFADPASVGDHLQSLAGVLPDGALAIVGEQMKRVAAQGQTTLGFGLLVSLGIALWSANAGMKTLFDALNIVYEEEEKRGFVRLTLVTLAFTVAAIAVLLAALGAVVVLPVVLDWIGLGSLETWLLLLRWPVLLALVAVGLTVIYRLAPSRERPQWRWVTWGGALAALGWVAVSALFSWYVQNFGSYNETYGSLGAAIGLMTWMWISTIVVLLGAELSAETEHQTAHDSTTRPDKPMGARGAHMADTLGETRG